MYHQGPYTASNNSLANNTSLVMQWCQGKIQPMLIITWHDTCLIAEDVYETIMKCSI